MGLQFSRSRTLVNSLIDVGTKVVVDQTHSSSMETVQDQTVICKDCDYCHISGVNQKAFLKVNYTDVVAQLSSDKMLADLTEAVRAKAVAETQGGFGYQFSDSETLENITKRVSVEIHKSAISTFQMKLIQKQYVACENTRYADITYVNQELYEDAIVKSITSQSSFNDSMTKIVSELDAASESKATGYDPVGSLAMIAILVVIGFLVFTVGGSVVGLKFAKNLLSSPYLWLTVLGVTSTLFTEMLAGEMVGFWPKRVEDHMDTQDEAASKAKTNKIVTAVSAIGLGASLLGMGGIIYFALIRGGSKTPSQIASK
jgi:hypothetical protein